MKRRRNDLELGLLPRTSFTSSMSMADSGGTGGGTGFTTGGTTQNSSARGLLGGELGTSSSRPSLDQLLNEQGSSSTSHDGLEGMGGPRGGSPGTTPGGGNGRLSFMVLSKLRKKMTTQTVRLKEKHEQDELAAAAEAQVIPLPLTH